MLKKLCKSILLLLAALAVVLLCVPGALAAGERGSIAVVLNTAEKNIPAGTLTLYYVAEPDKAGADEFYTPVAGFSSFQDTLYGISDEALGAQKLAADMYEFAKKLSGTTSPQSKDAVEGMATVKFEDLEQGLYLVAQTKPIKGYLDIAPFLVTVPCYEKIDVIAAPKYDQYTQPTDPSDSTDPTETTPPSGGGNGNLIQTGQLNWPVPILAICGILLFMLGWFLVFAGRESYES